MFEKPQYFTKDGFKRLSKNPYGNAETLRQFALLKKKKTAEAMAGRKSGQGLGISDEAAKLIAGVLKGMLNNPRK
jgi:hypothetical protein